MYISVQRGQNIHNTINLFEVFTLSSLDSSVGKENGTESKTKDHSVEANVFKSDIEGVFISLVGSDEEVGLSIELLLDGHLNENVLFCFNLLQNILNSINKKYLLIFFCKNIFHFMFIKKNFFSYNFFAL